MATVSYSWITVVPGFTLNSVADGNQADVAVTATAGGGYLGAWSLGSAYVRGRYVAAERHAGPRRLAHHHGAGQPVRRQHGAAGQRPQRRDLHDSGTDSVRIRILGENAVGTDVDFTVPYDTKPLRESDVTALGSDGFAVAYTRDYGGGDTDVYVQRYEADGDTIGGVIVVDSASSLATDHASITGLASGGFVVAWEQSATAGGAHSVWFQLYDSAGAAVTVAGDLPGSHHLIDNTGSINQDIQVAALQDGGFVVAYVDNGWGEEGDGTEITTKIYNADGTLRIGHQLVNEDVAGNQAHPTVSVLSNGYFLVGWVSANGDLIYQAYDPSGTEIGGNSVMHIGVVEGETAALADGTVASVRDELQRRWQRHRGPQHGACAGPHHHRRRDGRDPGRRRPARHHRRRGGERHPRRLRRNRCPGRRRGRGYSPRRCGGRPARRQRGHRHRQLLHQRGRGHGRPRCRHRQRRRRRGRHPDRHREPLRQQHRR